MVMATERFTDWSPASVFGATTPKPPPEHPRNTQSARESCRQQSASKEYSVSTKSLCSISSSTPDAAAEYEESRPSYSAGMPNCMRRKSVVEAREVAAAVLIKRRMRLALLRRREQETLHHVTALRSLLEDTAVSLLVRSFRRYLCRRRIHAYLTQWQHDETRVRTLLQHLVTKKRRLEAHITSEKRERHRQRQVEASSRIVRWYRSSVDHRHRQVDRVAVTHTSQRKIACWYRRMKLVRERLRQESNMHDRQNRALHLIQRFGRHRQRWKLESSSARIIQACWRQAKLIRAARTEVSRRREIRTGVCTLIAHTRSGETRFAFFKWLAVSRFLQLETQQRNASVRILQRAHQAWIARRHQQRIDASILSIQRLARGHQVRQRCRQLRAAAQRKRDEQAAILIQSQVRGFLARLRFAKILKQLRDRFRCANCGVIEPSGAYCKLCGRKRTNFDLLLSPRRHRHASEAKAVSDVSYKSATDVVHHLQFKMAPTRPLALPSSTSFAKLQAAKNGKIRHVINSSSQSSATKSSEMSVQDTAELQVISRLDSLPVVLSPRHVVQSRPVLRKRPTQPQRPQRHFQFDNPSSSNNNQTELHASPMVTAFALPEPSKTAEQTRLRAQALTKLQTQQQQNQLQGLSCAPALAQHMRRPQRAELSASRGR